MAPSTSGKKDVDGGWAWMVLLGSFMNLLLASGIVFVSGIFQKLFLEEFGESVAYTAWVTALFSSLMQLAGPLSGLVTSVTNCRVAVMIGGALIAVGLAASSFATSLNFLLVTFGLISGIGLGLMYTPSIVIINYYFDRRRSIMSGLSLSAAGIGITGSPILSRFLIDNTSWREALLILAAVSAHVCLFGALMFPLHEPSSSCAKRIRRACPGSCCNEADDDVEVVEKKLLKQTSHGDDRNGDVKLAERADTSCNCSQANLANGSLCEPAERGETPKHHDVISHANGHANDVSSDVVTFSSSLPKIAESAPMLDHVNNHQDDVRRAVLLNAQSRTVTSAEKGCLEPSLHEDDSGGEHHNIRSDEHQRFLPQEKEEAVRERKAPPGSTITEHPVKAGRSSNSTSGKNLFSSGTSLNKISHHLDGTFARANDHGARNNRQYNSSYSLHGHILYHHHHQNHHHHNNHHQSNDSLGRSLHSVDRGEPGKGSKLDLRVLSVYSSIASFHSLGLPQVEEIVALSPASAHDTEALGELSADGGEYATDQGGRCSNLMIFRNVSFLFLLANLFFSNAACGVFNIHVPAFAEERGLDDHDITFVLAMDGLAVFASRLLLGILGNDPAVDKLSVYFGLHLIASFVQSLLPFSENIVSVTLFTVGLGIYYGGVYALLSSLTISIVGLHALAFAFGVEMIAAGLGYLVAPPLAGWIVDETANYNNSMHLGGFLMFLSAISLLCVSFCRPPGAGPIGYHPVKADHELEVDEEEA